MNIQDQILMGNIQFGPELIPDEHYTDLDKCQMTAGGPGNPRPQIVDLSGLKAILPAPYEPPLPWDVPMTFRDFLRLKKEVLDAFEEWDKETTNWYAEEWPESCIKPEWPEALKGLTREDIEILKL